MYHAITNYEQVKLIFEGTKPIRGRAVEVRPIERRRDAHKQIIKFDGGYACRLFDVDCVKYYEDGRIAITDGGWRTITTGNFISRYSPFTCYKSLNYLWIPFAGKQVPLQPEVGFSARYMVNEFGEPVLRGDPVQIRIHTPNRERAKQSRERLMPFIRYATTILKLSDGWVDQTMFTEASRLQSQWQYVKDSKPIQWWRVESDRNFLDYILEHPDDEVYFAGMMAVLNHIQAVERNRASMRSRYDIKAFKRRVYSIHDKVTPEIYDAKYIEPQAYRPTNLPPV